MRPSPSYRQALARYAVLRRAAHEAARLAARDAGLAVRLTDLDTHALAVWQATWTGVHASGWGGWDWRMISSRYRRTPSAFHVALWSGAHLCGLAVGRASRRRADGTRAWVSLDRLEGLQGGSSPLKGRVAEVVVQAAEEYAGIIAAGRLRLVDPAPELEEHYRGFGFGPFLVGQGYTYSEKAVEQ